MRRDYAHIASRPGFGDSIVIYDNELSMWEILSWKYEVNLEELWEAAYNASTLQVSSRMNAPHSTFAIMKRS